MNWIEINIFTTTEGIDTLCASLTDIGIKGFAIKDSVDFKEFLDGKNGQWDYIDEDLMNLTNCETCITVYIPENAQGSEMMALLKTQVNRIKQTDIEKKFGRLDIELSTVREEDWANNWKQYFKPLEIGKKLTIKPSWEEYENNNNRIILEIDPASSFGTGQHNTTRLCLEILEDNVRKEDRVLDLGCGSGILSIGAILFGAGHVTAVDIEENAEKTTIENMQKNEISTDKYDVYCGNVISDNELLCKIGTGYDLITANIVADVIISMSDLFGKFLKNNGKLIISGIISQRKDEVLEVLTAKGFRVMAIKENSDWVAALLSL